MKRESLAFRALWQPPVDLDCDYKEQDRAHKQRLDTLLQLGTSPEQLRGSLARPEPAKGCGTGSRMVDSWRRFVMRYDWYTESYIAFLTIVCFMLTLSRNVG
jgi:hypothetical protein